MTHHITTCRRTTLRSDLQVHAPMMEDDSSSTSEQLRARAVEFSDVLEYIPRPCRPFQRKDQGDHREEHAQSEYLDLIAVKDMYVDIGPRQSQTQMQAQMQIQRSGDLLVNFSYPTPIIGCLFTLFSNISKVH